MPFTFAHPAIVLPFSRFSKWVSASGLIIGSLLPDFEYFLRMKIQGDYSHTLSGLFCFDWPLGVLLAFIFHNLVKNHLIDNLPGFLQSRFQVYSSLCWNKYFKKNAVKILISIWMGAASHLLWDSFTHISGYFVMRLPFLRSSFLFLGHTVPVYKVLQHGSSLFGCLFILYFVYKMPKISKIHKPVNSKYWLVFVCCTLLIIAIKIGLGLQVQQYGNLIVTAISAAIISLIISSLTMKIK